MFQIFLCDYCKLFFKKKQTRQKFYINDKPIRIMSEQWLYDYCNSTFWVSKNKFFSENNVLEAFFV